MSVHFTTTVDGSVIGAALAEDSEDAAHALINLAENVDRAELVDFLEYGLRHAAQHQRDAVLELAKALVTGLERSAK